MLHDHDELLGRLANFKDDIVESFFPDPPIHFIDQVRPHSNEDRTPLFIFHVNNEHFSPYTAQRRLRRDDIAS